MCHFKEGLIFHYQIIFQIKKQLLMLRIKIMNVLDGQLNLLYFPLIHTQIEHQVILHMKTMG